MTRLLARDLERLVRSWCFFDVCFYYLPFYRVACGLVWPSAEAKRLFHQLLLLHLLIAGLGFQLRKIIRKTWLAHPQHVDLPTGHKKSLQTWKQSFCKYRPNMSDLQGQTCHPNYHLRSASRHTLLITKALDQVYHVLAIKWRHVTTIHTATG